ncbi:MAG: peptidoglycan-binding protein [Alphaproteobacteria bacterium]|nr:MAG: peptidoglycan-binding protein [Alphaproteobacteria bacterium]
MMEHYMTENKDIQTIAGIDVEVKNIRGGQGTIYKDRQTGQAIDAKAAQEKFAQAEKNIQAQVNDYIKTNYEAIGGRGGVTNYRSNTGEVVEHTQVDELKEALFKKIAAEQAKNHAQEKVVTVAQETVPAVAQKKVAPVEIKDQDPVHILAGIAEKKQVVRGGEFSIYKDRETGEILQDSVAQQRIEQAKAPLKEHVDKIFAETHTELTGRFGAGSFKHNETGAIVPAQDVAKVKEHMLEQAAHAQIADNNAKIAQAKTQDELRKLETQAVETKKVIEGDTQRTLTGVDGIVKKGDYIGPDSNPQVIAGIQRQLGCDASGIWCPKTEEAITKLQKTLGVEPDGIIGPITLQAMRENPVVVAAAQMKGAFEPLIAQKEKLQGETDVASVAPPSATPKVVTPVKATGQERFV